MYRRFCRERNSEAPGKKKQKALDCHASLAKTNLERNEARAYTYKRRASYKRMIAVVFSKTPLVTATLISLNHSFIMGADLQRIYLLAYSEHSSLHKPGHKYSSELETYIYYSIFSYPWDLHTESPSRRFVLFFRPVR